MKKNFCKKLLLVLMTLAMMLALFACGDKPCTHKDEDGDGICDSCKTELKAPEPERKVDLVVDGEYDFQFVMTSKSPSTDIIKEVTQIINGLGSLGVKNIKRVSENEAGSEKDVEILIGDVTTRGEKYDYNEKSLGTDGYIVKIIDTKIIITAGSNKALLKAVKEFGEKITKAPEDGGKKIQNLAFKQEDEFSYIKNDYPITSVSFGGEDIRDFTIATYMYNLTYMEAAKNIQNTLYLNTGYWLDRVFPRTRNHH